MLICINERWILTPQALAERTNDCLLLILFLFLDSRESRHRTIVAEIENDSTFVQLVACATDDCVQLEDESIIDFSIEVRRRA